MSNTIGTRTFHLNLSVPTESGLELRKFLDDKNRIEKIEVVTERLDAFGLANVDFLKLDCEGAELDVLVGATETLRRSRPLISIEYGAAGYLAYGHTKLDLFEWTRDHGYVVSDLFGRLMLTAETFDLCVDRYYWDFFLVPQDRIGEFVPKLRAGATKIFDEFNLFLNT